MSGAEEQSASDGPIEPERPDGGIPMKGNDSNPKAVDFRVALALSRYGFGAMYTAKQLLRSRGMVQSWKKMGKKHYLAEKPYNKRRVARRLWKIRRVTTFRNLDYHIAKRLFEYDLSSSYIAKKLEIPVSTVNSWRKGNSPSSVRENFVDEELVDSKLSSILDSIKGDLTEENMEYFLSRKISEEAAERQEKGTRNIGARTISSILEDFLHIDPLPERTVSSWIKGERKPHNIDEELVDEELIEVRFQQLALELTKEHINYHVAMELDERGWSYSAISLFLGIDKEKVRGWIKKDRGNPVAKTFVNAEYVKKVVTTMLETNEGVENAMTCNPHPLEVIEGTRDGRSVKRVRLRSS